MFQLTSELKTHPVLNVTNTICFLSLRILDAKGLLLARRGVQDDVWPHYPPYPRRTSNRILANLARYHYYLTYHNDDDMVKSGSCLVHPAMTCLLNLHEDLPLLPLLLPPLLLLLLPLLPPLLLLLLLLSRQLLLLPLLPPPPPLLLLLPPLPPPLLLLLDLII